MSCHTTTRTHPQALTKRDYASLCRYYDGRDDLAAYTLDTELSRLAYSIVMEDGRTLGSGTASTERRGRTGNTGQGRGEEGEDGGGTGESESVVRDYLRGRESGDVMLRMANQSIFADMLEVGSCCCGSRVRVLC